MGVRAIKSQGPPAPLLAHHWQTLTGLQPPVIGSGPHCLIPHIPVVDQILHQCVHITYREAAA